MRDVLQSLQRLVGQRTHRATAVIRSHLSKELCPYCFDYFSMASAPFRCSPPIRCTPEVDDILKDKWNDATPRGKVIKVDGYVRSCICPECKNETKQRLCPNCHQDLPHTIGDFRNIVISVVGAKNAGKSHYLPMLIENLKNTVGPDLKFTIGNGANDDTRLRYRRDYYNPLINQHRVLDTTRSGIADVRSRLPLVFELRPYDVRADGQRRIKTVVTLAFFDTAGEDLNSRDTMAYVNKYIYRSDGIILLLDPLQLDFVRDRLKGSISLPDRDIETSDIVSRVDELIRIGTDLHSGEIDIPIAVTLSKFDAVEGLVDRGFEIVRNANHVGGFDLCDFRNTDAEVQSLIDHWGGQSLIDQIKTGFSRHGFFAVSALGGVPHNDRVASLRPKRVADPLLWILHSQKLIKAKPESKP